MVAVSVHESWVQGVTTGTIVEPASEALEAPQQWCEHDEPMYECRQCIYEAEAVADE